VSKDSKNLNSDKPKFTDIYMNFAKEFPDLPDDDVAKKAKNAYNYAVDEYDKHIEDKKDKTMFNITSYIDTLAGFNETGRNANPIKPKRIQYYVTDPESNKDNLLRVCSQLYTYIQEYKQIIMRYGAMLNYYPVVNPIEDVSQESFINALKYFEGYNYKSKLGDITQKILKYDVYFGYEVSRRGTTKKILKEMPRGYCRLIGRDEYGVYLYQFDLSYFTKNKDVLNTFPKEFKFAYNEYKNKDGNRWYEPDNKKQFAFKFDTTVNYMLPYFSGIFVDLARLQEIKVIQTLNAKFENYKLIHYKIPINDKSGDMNDFLIDPDLALKYHDLAEKHLPKGIGLTTNPFDLDVANLQATNSADNNLVDRHYSNLLSSTGMSRLLTNNNTTGSTGLNASVKVDEAMMFKVLRQYEAFFTRQLSYRKNKSSFTVSFINSTVHNEEEVHKKYREDANTGFNRFYVSSSAGISQLEVIYGRKIEQEMNLDELLDPLSTAHTQSGEDDNTKSDSELSDSGEEARDKE